MSGALSNYTEGKMANVLLRGTAYTTPGEIFLSLFTSNPGEDGSGTESSYSGYARKSCGVTPASAFSAVDVTGMTQNANTVVFPAVGGVSSVTVTHWALFDALTIGNMLLYGPLAANKTLDPTDVPSFPANALKVTFD